MDTRVFRVRLTPTIGFALGAVLLWYFFRTGHRVITAKGPRSTHSSSNGHPFVTSLVYREGGRDRVACRLLIESESKSILSEEATIWKDRVGLLIRHTRRQAICVTLVERSMQPCSWHLAILEAAPFMQDLSGYERIDGRRF